MVDRVQVRPSLLLCLWSCLLVVGCDDGGESDEATGSSSGDASSGADSSTGTELPEVDYEADVQPIWNANCTCHLMGQSGTMQAPFLTLNPGMSHAQLVGVAAEQGSGLVRVTAGELEASYLWRKLNDTHLDAGGEGTSMPPPPTALDEAALAIIEAWIVGGAQP